MEYSPTSGVEIDYEIKDNKVFFKGILRRLKPNHYPWKSPHESIENYNEMVFQFQNKVYVERTHGDYYCSDKQENYKNAFYIKDVYTKIEDGNFLILGELVSTTEAGGMRLLEDAKKNKKFVSKMVWECDNYLTSEACLKELVAINIISPSFPQGETENE